MGLPEKALGLLAALFVIDMFLGTNFLGTIIGTITDWFFDWIVENVKNRLNPL